jgi:hypothetical protein
MLRIQFQQLRSKSQLLVAVVVVLAHKLVPHQRGVAAAVAGPLFKYFLVLLLLTH